MARSHLQRHTNLQRELLVPSLHPHRRTTRRDNRRRNRNRQVDRPYGAWAPKRDRKPGPLHCHAPQLCPTRCSEEQELLQHRRGNRRGEVLGHLQKLETHSARATLHATNTHETEPSLQGHLHYSMLVRIEEDPRQYQGLGTITGI